MRGRPGGEEAAMSDTIREECLSLYLWLLAWDEDLWATPVRNSPRVGFAVISTSS